MSSIAITGGATGTGVFSLVAPSTSTNRTINLPDSNGTILTTATAGVPVNGPAFSAYLSTAQNISNGVTTKIAFDTKEFDTSTAFNTTNYRFTPQVAGYYQVVGTMYPNTTTSLTGVFIYKNGANIKAIQSTGANVGPLVTALVYLNGSTDYIELYGNISGVTPQIYSSSAYTYFQASMVRSAT